MEQIIESHVHCLQALLTDMAAHSYVIDDINKMADKMIADNHSKTPAVKKRRDEINSRCDCTATDICWLFYWR